MKKVRLILFTRYPVPGQCKTRMIPVLGPQGAAELQKEMTSHQLRTFNKLKAPYHFEVEVRYTGGDDLSMTMMFGPGNYREQGSGDLGERMRRAMLQAFKEGFDYALILGADCPEVDAQTLQEALDAMRSTDMSLGPAEDGGYYLIAAKRDIPEVFTNVDWGTERVLAQTLFHADQAGYIVHLLDVRHDVDRPEDLEIWNAVKSRHQV